ncbi:hypothetical protein [Gymnodinialimonas sp.]
MTEKTDNGGTSAKAEYEAPHLTDHGSLEEYTKSATSSPGVDGGDS